jgi:hypothetical protein
MIVGDITPDLDATDSLIDSSIAVLNNHSDSSWSGQSPVLRETLQVINTPLLSGLSQQSSYESVPECYIKGALRDSVRPLVEGESQTFAFPSEWIAAFGDSGNCAGQGAAIMLTPEDDEALVRMTIRSLDVGEEPVFDLPLSWKDAFTSPRSDVTPPSFFEVEPTRKASVLPKLKSLWKRAASKLMPRKV